MQMTAATEDLSLAGVIFSVTEDRVSPMNLTSKRIEEEQVGLIVYWWRPQFNLGHGDPTLKATSGGAAKASRLMPRS